MAKDKTDIDVPQPPTQVTEKLHVLKDGVDYPIHLYATEAGAGTPGPTTGTLKLRMGGVNYFARITQNLDSNSAGGATPLRYKNSAGAIYQVTQKAEFSIIVPDASGQTVCVSANGQTYKGANTLWFAEGTVWKAWVETDVNHHPGTLNLTGGTLNSTINLSVTPAADIPSGRADYWSDDQSFPQTLTVPNYITVLCVHETTRDSRKETHYYKVTPGKSYQITRDSYRHKQGSSYVTTVMLYFNGIEVTRYTGYHQAEFNISWSGEINQHATEADFS